MLLSYMIWFPQTEVDFKDLHQRTTARATRKYTIDQLSYNLFFLVFKINHNLVRLIWDTRKR